MWTYLSSKTAIDLLEVQVKRAWHKSYVAAWQILQTRLIDDSFNSVLGGEELTKEFEYEGSMLTTESLGL